MMHKEEGKTWKERSDIGGFSLPDSSFKGTRHSRARGLFEHGLLWRAIARDKDNKAAGEEQTCGVPQGREG